MAFDYIEMMANASSVVRVTDDGDCHNLFLQLGNLLYETASMFEMAGNREQDDFAGFAKMNDSVYKNYVNVVDDMLAATKAWQLSGFDGNDVETIVEKVMRTIDVCNESDKMCASINEFIHMDKGEDSISESTASINAIVFPKIEAVVSELTAAIEIVRSRLEKYLVPINDMSE